MTVFSLLKLSENIFYEYARTQIPRHICLFSGYFSVSTLTKLNKRPSLADSTSVLYQPRHIHSCRCDRGPRQAATVTSNRAMRTIYANNIYGYRKLSKNFTITSEASVTWRGTESKKFCCDMRSLILRLSNVIILR